MKLLLLCALTAAVLGCSRSKSPTSPTPGGGPGPTSFTLSGTVTATNGNQPLSGITLSISGQAPVQTNSSGAFSLTLPPVITPYRVDLTGAGIIGRQMMVNVTNGRNVSLDVIRQDGTFDLAYYRQLVRNSLESSVLQPLRRFSVPPRIYLRTVDDRGTPINPRTLDQTAASLINAAGEMTGKFGLAGMEMGTSTRQGQAGWLTVVWTAEGRSGLCGLSNIGAEGGVLELYYRNPNCSCPRFAFAPHTVKHELGHALGFWHTNGAGDLMNGGDWDISQCEQGMTARERYHAAIAYSRPVGNTDPDIDPPTAISLAPATVRH